jgi:excisionase family DNA binding protein
MKRSLAPHQAAELLGISVDTLRHWERDGKITARRTHGGHRRYAENEVRMLAASVGRTGSSKRRVARVSDSEAFRDIDSDESEPSSSAVEFDLPPSAPDGAPSWEFVAEHSTPIPEALRVDHEAARAAEQDAAVRREHERLERLRQYGRSRAFGTPALQQAQVNRELLAFVTAANLPAELDDASSHQLIGARVDQILQPWRDQEWRSRTIADLVQAGLLHASIVTFRWMSEDADEAKREVKADLQASVKEDWTPKEVEKLVDEVLAEWSDEDEDD